MAQCCGCELTTAFCPHCGKPQSETPLHGLLRHCRQKHLATQRLRDNRQRQLDRLPADNAQRPWVASSLSNCDRTVAKWASWITALEQAMGLTPPTQEAKCPES